jgi:CRP/FNR family transcriptional regulator, cyclic AMP receptor protein
MTESSDSIAFFRTVPLLAGLSDASLLSLASNCRMKNVPKGYIIFSRGGPADLFYMIYSGLTAEFAGSPNSDVEIFIKERRPGDFFGEMGILLNEPASVTEMAIQDTTLILVRREIFLKLVDREPSVASFLMRTFARRVKASGEQQATNTLLPAHARLAYIVLRLEQEEGGKGVISQTQDYLAQRSGLARQTVARILGEWGKRGWISTHRGWVEVKDRPGITQALELKSH